MFASKPESGVGVSAVRRETLLDPPQVPLAAAEGEGDGWALAGRFAARMLPAIFRPDDPVLAVRLAPEHQQKLEALLAGLPSEVFSADDSLGWVYQFWQTKRKKEVNDSGRKIGAEELPAVTQLFTEPYMVKFLLHNTLGAWWAGKVLASRPELAASARSEEELRKACLPAALRDSAAQAGALPGYEWSYLRFIRECAPSPSGGGAGGEGIWRPAAGTFEAWPRRVAEIKVLDPCSGSGHFVVEALRILVPMRMAEEGLSAREACDAVLRDNLFGLEIDERCTQIAAFNLALAAWAYPGAGGYRPLPELNIACSGLSVGAKEEDWLKLAGREERLREGMRRLYRLFQDAPTLGSLIDPRREGADLLSAGFEELRPLLARALEREEVKRDAVAAEVGIAAQGMAKAAALLAGSYTLAATNVPYLGHEKQGAELARFADRYFRDARKDLATVFLCRLLEMLSPGGTCALVVTQNWLFLASYRKLRQRLLHTTSWNLLSRLGEHAFESTAAAGAFVAMLILTNSSPASAHRLSGLNASAADVAREKTTVLMSDSLALVSQQSQLKNPDFRIVLGSIGASQMLRDFAIVSEGLHTGDYPRFGRKHWEVPSVGRRWAFQQGGTEDNEGTGGCEHLLLWDDGKGELVDFIRERLGGQALSLWIKGEDVWGKRGVAVGTMRDLKHSHYAGALFTHGIVAIVPKNPRHLAALWSFGSSKQFRDAVRMLDQKVCVARGSFEQVPFDLVNWQKIAADEYPGGLPEPYSDDPTQWIFHGHPARSTAPLQVTAARLLGYRWPAETDPKMDLSEEARDWIERARALLDLADEDGIVCIPPMRGEQPAATRLQDLLARAYGGGWTPSFLATLLEQVGYKGKSLDEWLRDGFFEQHCQLFRHRPFVWHIWDGRRRDGFAALVNYHRLDRKCLERLAYTYLGDWIEEQRRGVKAGETGAEDRLAAAFELQKKLGLILEGEPPYDIFVRWKPIEKQPIGWDPDLNDGVRLNIRPFVEAGILRKSPRMNWKKDRGNEPNRPQEQYPWFWRDGGFTGDRVNDVHLSIAEKRAARAAGERSC